MQSWPVSWPFVSSKRAASTPSFALSKSPSRRTHASRASGTEGNKRPISIRVFSVMLFHFRASFGVVGLQLQHELDCGGHCFASDGFEPTGEPLGDEAATWFHGIRARIIPIPQV